MRNVQCYCNVCLLPMVTTEYVQGGNCCSKDCREIMRSPRNLEAMKFFEFHVRKGRAPVALRMACGEK